MNERKNENAEMVKETDVIIKQPMSIQFHLCALKGKGELC